jgi:hypothetical protein
MYYSRYIMSSSFYVKRGVDTSTSMLSAVFSGTFKACHKYFVVIMMMIIISAVLLYAKNDPRSLNSMTYVYAFSAIIPAVIAFLYVQKISPFGEDSVSSSVFYATIFLIILVYAVFYYYNQYSTVTTFLVMGFTVNVVMIFTIVLGMAIFYNIFTDYIKQMRRGSFGMAIQIIFFIPCLLSDLIEYLIGEYKITPTIVFIMFIVELILILMWLYIPVLIKLSLTSTGVILVADQLHLDTRTQLANSDDLLSKMNGPLATSTELDESGLIKSVISNSTNTAILADSDGNMSGIKSKDKDSVYLLKAFGKVPVRGYPTRSKHYLSNYSISLWVFINVQSKSNKAYSQETTIFNYGYTDSDGKSYSKPKITYSQSDGVYYIYYTTYSNNKNSMETSRHKITINNEGLLPNQAKVMARSQKWNNFVINYVDNGVDLFINGELIRSIKFGENNVPFPEYALDDTISVGDYDGIYGSICNVRYFPMVLTKSHITAAYNYYNLRSLPMD